LARSIANEAGEVVGAEEGVSAQVEPNPTRGGRVEHPTGAAPAGTPHARSPSEEQPVATMINVAGASPEIFPDLETDDLKIILGDFEGPLDLLLHLIRQEQVSIYDIPVARITDAYLKYLQLMQELDIAVAGDFLVMAATLIELKTKMLLPRDPFAATEGEEDDPRLDLVNQLLEYQKYKAAAQMLWSRATIERAIFRRAELETDKNNPEVVVGVFDLLRVFNEILARHKEEVLLEIEREEITMAQMLERLRNMVMSAGELNLREFFERAGSRRELVLAFLSVLELVRTTEVRLFQEQTFGEIIARVAS
jgi:segregation and condensation protein A